MLRANLPRTVLQRAPRQSPLCWRSSPARCRPNVTRLTTLWSQRDVGRETRRSQSDGRNHQASTEREKKSVDNFTLLSLGRRRGSNSLIDGRTFSWTVFFGLSGNHVAAGRALIAVAPREERASSASICQRQTPDDLSTFLDALQATNRSTNCCRASEPVAAMARGARRCRAATWRRARQTQVRQIDGPAGCPGGRP
jgi:hypothetical protein